MKIGDRVGAIRDANQKIVNMFGYGTYEGEEIPPENTIGAFGLDLHELKMTNPKIELDNGNIVWGCQCWWGSEEKIKESIGDREVVFVELDK